MPFFVYILASKRNGTLYIGVTKDIVRRISEHKAKLIPGFTRQYDVTLEDLNPDWRDLTDELNTLAT